MRSFRRSLVCLTGVISIASLFLLLRAAPAYAVDDVESTATGGLDVFQLDGAGGTTANANTCVGSEGGPCSSAGEENPSWPADWDPLVNPSLTNPASTFITGGGSP